MRQKQIWIKVMACALIAFAGWSLTRDDAQHVRRGKSKSSQWFGGNNAQLNAIFPELPNFAQRDVGFML